jgi:small multidrug resistance pump
VITYVLLGLAIAAEVAGTLSLKHSRGFTAPLMSAVVVVCYVVAIVLLAQVLNRGMAVAVAYAVWSAVGITVVAALGAVLLGESLTTTQVVGIALIVVGVVTLELGAASG